MSDCYSENESHQKPIRERAFQLLNETADVFNSLLSAGSMTALAEDVVRQTILALQKTSLAISSDDSSESELSEECRDLLHRALRHAENGWGVTERVRILPVYLLLDTSGSMRGEPIESVRVGLESMLRMLRSNERVMESVQISIIRFDRDVETLTPLTALPEFRMPELVTPDSGPTHLGLALEELCNRMQSDLCFDNDQMADPMLLVMTDGSPSDRMKYNEMVERIRTYRFGRIIACAAGAKARTNELKQLADVVVSLDTMDSSSFSRLFEWFFQNIFSAGESSTASLPPPPPEFQIVL